MFLINLLLLKSLYWEFYTVVYRPIKLFTGHMYVFFKNLWHWTNLFIANLRTASISYVFVFTSAHLGSCSCDQSFRVIYIYTAYVLEGDTMSQVSLFRALVNSVVPKKLVLLAHNIALRIRISVPRIDCVRVRVGIRYFRGLG